MEGQKSKLANINLSPIISITLLPDAYDKKKKKKLHNKAIVIFVTTKGMQPMVTQFSGKFTEQPCSHQDYLREGCY